jgi:hypothetical protein
MTRVEWVEPALLWEGRKLESIKRPRLLEIQNDDFMPEFLGAMAASDGHAPPAEYLKTKAMDGAAPRLKLYQPLHGCYYLVTGSLVCRQLGLPDKSVERKNSERTTFVIRRYNTVQDASGQSYRREEGWVDGGAHKGWQALADEKGKPVPVRADEERFPMHAVVVCTQSAPEPFGSLSIGTLGRGEPSRPCCERTIYHGYIAAGNREKYIQKFTAPDPAPTAALSHYLQELDNVTQTTSPGALDRNFDFRLDEFDSRVIAAWQSLLADGAVIDAARRNEASLYILLDLADTLERLLPGLWEALVEADINLLNGRPHTEDLFKVLTNSFLPYGDADDVPLAKALRDLKDKIGLVRGEDIEEPATVYDLTTVQPKDENGADLTLQDFVGNGPAVASILTAYVKAALPEEPQPMKPTDELASLLKDQVKLEPVDPATGKEATYFLRLVYEYDPDCPPIVSEGSQPFTFAKFFEPDAPARHIRLELPSIKMKDLRKYKKGAGLQMSPELRDVMNRVHKGMLDGDPLLPGGGSWELGMICSFSIQIIFLVAFIVMFIFLIMLNIVFWWMAFLKICFPIPMKSQG